MATPQNVDIIFELAIKYFRSVKLNSAVMDVLLSKKSQMARNIFYLGSIPGVKASFNNSAISSFVKLCDIDAVRYQSNNVDKKYYLSAISSFKIQDEKFHEIADLIHNNINWKNGMYKWVAINFKYFKKHVIRLKKLFWVRKYCHQFITSTKYNYNTKIIEILNMVDVLKYLLSKKPHPKFAENIHEILFFMYKADEINLLNLEKVDYDWNLQFIRAVKYNNIECAKYCIKYNHVKTDVAYLIAVNNSAMKLIKIIEKNYTTDSSSKHSVIPYYNAILISIKNNDLEITKHILTNYFFDTHKLNNALYTVHSVKLAELLLSFGATDIDTCLVNMFRNNKIHGDLALFFINKGAKINVVEEFKSNIDSILKDNKIYEFDYIYLFKDQLMPLVEEYVLSGIFSCDNPDEMNRLITFF